MLFFQSEKNREEINKFLKTVDERYKAALATDNMQEMSACSEDYYLIIDWFNKHEPDSDQKIALEMQVMSINQLLSNKGVSHK